ncbi:M4 family metallopeptidase [Microtetraspora malaysiensis]|uniref:M4 family metallopeptidase n=1 Tax=Microtetraspora malaysiensis TaxID=161358 RepID=UPI003D8F838C
MNPTMRSGAVALLAAVALTTASLTAMPAASAAGADGSQAAAQAAPPPSPAFAQPDAQQRKNAVASAGKALAADTAALHASADDTFQLVRDIAGTRGLQYLTYQRSHRGVPVYGGDVVVATDSSGQVIETVTTGQETTLKLDVTATVTADAAAGTARAQLAAADSVATPELVVHATTARPRLAWEVVVTGTAKHGGPSVQHVYVDAKSGKVIDAWDEVRDGTGSSNYHGTVTLATSGSGSSYSMTDPNRPGLRCGGQGGTAYTKSSDSWGNGSGTDLETACVDAIYAAQVEWNMLRDWLGRNGHNGSGSSFPARVGLNDVNAYWNGSYTNFGHNQANNKQATTYDVVAHEYGHAIFQFSGSGGAGSGNEAGGLNESTGDIFGALTEHFANEPAPYDTPDYLVGEQLNLTGTGPIRNMYNPSALGDPNCYSASIPSTEVHAAAGPQNHWFYLLAEGNNPGGGKPTSPTCNSTTVTGIGIQKAGQIFMGGLNLKTTPWTHAKARVATLNAAKSLFPNGCTEFNAVKAAWAAVSVNAQSGEPTCTAVPGNDFSVSLSPTSGSVQTGQSTTTRVNTAVISGTAQPVTLSTRSLPNGVTASFNPATVTAGQSSTLTLSASSTATGGTFQMTVVGTAGSTTHEATFSLTVGRDQPPANDFSVSVNPSSASVQAGQSATATLGTQVVTGNAESLGLSVSNAPAGVTVTFSPSTITAGQTSTVTIATSSTTTAGTYTINLNAAGASAGHSAAFSLTVGGGGGETTWATWTSYKAGDVVTYNGVRYRCLQAHTSLPGWEPPNVPALWQPI